MRNYLRNKLDYCGEREKWAWKRVINCLSLPGTERGAHDAGLWELRNGDVLGKPGRAGHPSWEVEVDVALEGDGALWGAVLG